MTYMEPSQLPLHFCPGCAHDIITRKIDEALDRIKPDPKKTVIVTDIGCAGLTDKYFITNAFHGLHGRSMTYGCGIKLANPELTVIVLIGDGGCGIGGHHLINAARRNIGITVIVYDNFNFGMTGGQHSITTPVGGITATTRAGNYEYPVDICQTIAVNHAGWVGRTSAYDPDITDLLPVVYTVELRLQPFHLYIRGVEVGLIGEAEGAEPPVVMEEGLPYKIILYQAEEGSVRPYPLQE